jgi:anti-sigma factor RsiW
MRCRKTQRLLSAGELSEAQQGPVDEHLGRCPDCRRFKAHLDLLASRLEALMPVPEPRAGFAGRTLARIPDDEPRATWLVRLGQLIQPAPVALAAVAAASLAMGVFLAVSMNGAGREVDQQSVLFAEFFDVPSLESER